VTRAFTLLLTLSFLLCLSAKSQLINAPRDLPAAFKQTPKLLIGLDTRRSFVSGRDVKVMGLRVGLEFEKRARVGFGMYTLASEFTRNFVFDDAFGGKDTVEAQLQFAYMNVFFEYVLLTTKHWEVSFPIHLGIGDQSYSKIPFIPNSFLLGEAGVWASYKIFPFLGLAGGVGYRQLLATGATIRKRSDGPSYGIHENFNAPTYNIGIKFWAGYLIEKIRNKAKL
jgi:hypothetical protein